MTHGYPITFARKGASDKSATSLTYLRRLDWVLIAAAVALSSLGALLVWSATRQWQIDRGLDPTGFLKKHVLDFMIGVGLGWVVSRFNYRLLRAYTPILYVLSVLGLIVVLSPLGGTINGAHAWIILPGGFTIQPSEFAKLAIILGMSMILAEKHDAENVPHSRDILIAGSIAAVCVGLIMLQPDLGSTLVIITMVIAIISVSGAPSKWVAGLLIAVVLAGFGAVQFGFLKQHQVNRLVAFADPNADPKGIGYNTQQARIAIGSGGMWGTGLFKGPQTNGRFVPEQQSDFIYSVAGEELGFVGSSAIIILLGVILWRGSRIAFRAGDMFGRLVAAGIVAWFAFQAFENIGMNLGIMPVTGVPLPFVSYGGTAMFAGWLAIGLLQNVHLGSEN
jgi:rod shape determining protein RodA